MKTKAILIAISLGGLLAVPARAQAPDQFKTDKEKNSYALGAFYGGNWKKQEIDVDPDQFLRGVKDSLAGKAMFSEQETSEILKKFQSEIFAKAQEKRKQLAEKNKKTGEEFLAANKSKPGVVTLPSGLQYKIVSEGAGESPKATDTVTVNYRGTLLDGTEFDSSAKAGKPATFRVGGVIAGWSEALQLMKPGAKWQLFIPSDLAYKEFGNQKIEPNSTLQFEVELISVQPAPPPPAPAAPLTSDIIKVPSIEEMKKGAKIETIKAEDVEKLQKEQAEKEKNAPKK